MQRFTLIHDGSSQAWQTAYLAFHVSARLGARLQVLLVGASADPQIRSQIAVGGRAAGVVLETRVLKRFSLESVTQKIDMINGLFLPSRLLADNEMVGDLLEALACPLWIVSEEPQTREMAVLVESLVEDADLIAYASLLAQRLGDTLTGLILGNAAPPDFPSEASLTWLPVPDFSLSRIALALDQLQADLLCVKPSRFPQARELGRSCVVYPGAANP